VGIADYVAVSSRLRFSVLGPLRGQCAGRPAELGPVRQQALLAMLLLRGGRPVPAAELLDGVWDETEQPASGTRVVPPYVYRLRGLLAAGGAGIVRSGGGYQLVGADLDLADFAGLVRRAEERAAAGAVAEAGDLLAEALALWRGDPLAGLPGPYAAARRADLAERRLTALERRLEFDLRLGRQDAVVAELVALRAEHPTRERLAGMAMTALYRCGRQAEALATYVDTRRALRTSLGVTPGAELDAVHAAVLGADDDGLGVPPAPAEVRSPAPRDPDRPPGRCDLPRPAADFVGRTADLAVLLADRAGGPAVVALDGMAGVGKTTLAVHAAHRLAARHPDGQVFVDLHGHTPGRPPREPADVLFPLLRAIGVDPAQIPPGVADRQARWRAELAHRRFLLVLDNAADAAQVAPLLATGPGCLTLVTSRRRLTGLPDATAVSLRPLSEEEGSQLLLGVLGERRRAGQEAGARQVAALCGGLPLAIRIAACRLRHRPTWTLEYVADRLGTSRLGELAAEHRRVDEAFRLSYEQLTPPEQRTFRLLSLVTGPDFDVFVAAAVTGLSTESAARLLDDLLEVNLLLQPHPGRYAFHDLVAEYAAGLAAAERAEGTAVRRLLDYYLQVTVTARGMVRRDHRLVTLSPAEPPAETPALLDRDDALHWLDTEADTIVALAGAFADAQPERVWKLAAAAAPYFATRCAFSALDELLAVGLAASRRLGDRLAESTLLLYVGLRHSSSGGTQAAVAAYRRALEMKREVGDRVGELALLVNLANNECVLGQYRSALEHLADAERRMVELGRDDLAAFVHQNIGMVLSLLGRHDEAEQALWLAVDSALAHGLEACEGFARTLLGELLTRAGEHPAAEEQLRIAVAAGRRAGDQSVAAYALTALGALHRERGQHGTAIEYHQAALAAQDGLRMDQVEQQVRIGYGDSLHAFGRPAPAAAEFRRALQLHGVVGDPYLRARALTGLGDVAAATGDRAAAVRHWTTALGQLVELGCTGTDLLRNRLDRAAD
jgi:DNA-binding SARP family transcriptional activator/tetratricopeptide (TPR) repeat protein